MKCPAATMIRLALSCKCPRCATGDLYTPGLSLTVCDECASCGLKLADNDSGDGPVVFLIFVLGLLLVPLALLFEWAFSPPLWVHAVLWTIVALSITLGTMRPLKAYIIALQFKYRSEDWPETDKEEDREEGTE